jgi:DNA repair exonuclease SbcCD nuclease subunit
MSFRVSHCGDVHIEEDRYFGDTAQCLEWFVHDGIRQRTDLFVIDGDLTTYKATIKERNLWIDMVIRMADHAPVLIVSGNHGKESDGDLYALAKAKGKHSIYLSTGPELIELSQVAIATFPYPRKADRVGTQHEKDMQEGFVEQLEEFNRQFARRPGSYHLFFGHFGVAGARVSSGQPLVGRCAEYPEEPLRCLNAQYVGLSHIHLRQELAPRIWYAGSLSRCDYSEMEDKGYNLVTLKQTDLAPDLTDLDVSFRRSPTRPMMELHVRYEDGKFALPKSLEEQPSRLKDARVKVVVTVAKGLHESLNREAQDQLREKLLAGDPSELKLKIEHQSESGGEIAPVSLAKTAEDKLKAYWEIRGTPSEDQKQRLLAKLGQIEVMVASKHSVG